MKNIFIPINPENKLHKSFKFVCNEKIMQPAKLLIEEITSNMNDNDGNFIQQFQTTGFNSRLWEIFLFKFLSVNGFNFDDSHNRPDFHIEKDQFDFYIEASLSNDVEEKVFTREYIEKAEKENDLIIQKKLIEHYVMRMGSVLYSKLQKQYWKLDWVKGKPLIFAITPAHNHMARFMPDAKIIEYLYGLSFKSNNSGLKLEIIKTEVHKYENKEIPSNFFSLKDTENISAVLFTNNSDLHKFNRMAYQNGMSDLHLIMERIGLAFNQKPSPYPIKFRQSIKPREIKEDWNESVSLFHNPNAKFPIKKGLFGNIRELWINEDGEIDGTIPNFFPINSITGCGIIE